MHTISMCDVPDSSPSRLNEAVHIRDWPSWAGRYMLFSKRPVLSPLFARVGSRYRPSIAMETPSVTTSCDRVYLMPKAGDAGSCGLKRWALLL